MYPLTSSPRLARSLADAFVIAALLAVSVDRYVKGRVLHEVTADVSKYLIGYPSSPRDYLHAQRVRVNFIRAFIAILSLLYAL